MNFPLQGIRKFFDDVLQMELKYSACQDEIDVTFSIAELNDIPAYDCHHDDDVTDRDSMAEESDIEDEEMNELNHTMLSNGSTFGAMVPAMPLINSAKRGSNSMDTIGPPVNSLDSKKWKDKSYCMSPNRFPDKVHISMASDLKLKNFRMNKMESLFKSCLHGVRVVFRSQTSLVAGIMKDALLRRERDSCEVNGKTSNLLQAVSYSVIKRKKAIQRSNLVEVTEDVLGHDCVPFKIVDIDRSSSKDDSRIDHTDRNLKKNVDMDILGTECPRGGFSALTNGTRRGPTPKSKQSSDAQNSATPIENDILSLPLVKYEQTHKGKQQQLMSSTDESAEENLIITRKNRSRKRKINFRYKTRKSAKVSTFIITSDEES